MLSTSDKDKDGEEKDTEWKEVCGPETDTSFELSGCQT